MNNKIFMRVLLLTVFCLSYTTLKAQEAPMSNSAGLAKYADMPVNMYTGTLGTSIFLATAPGNALSLSVSLSYHGAGIKVQERASRVGLGWTLNGGGVITRTVFGTPDEKAYLKQTEYTKTMIANSNFQNPMNFSNGQYDFLGNIMDGEIDIEPDAFYFNISGRSGKFYFTPEREAVLESYSGILIEVDKDLTYFTLTDESGTKYYFREQEYSFSRPLREGVTGSQQNHPSSWYLTEIIDISGESIQFEYETFPSTEKSISRGDKIILMYPDNAIHYSQTNIRLLDPLSVDYDNGGYISPDLYGTFGYTLPDKIIETKTDYCKRVSKIYARNGYLSFKYGKRDDHDYEQKLEMIGVFVKDSQGNSRLLNRIFCEYDYYTNEQLPGGLNLLDSEADKKRLRLRKIYTKNNEQQATPPYIFTYESGILPNPNSLAQDYQGYYNGKNDNATLSPSTTIDNIYYQGADRNFDFQFAKRGILTEITYPSGNSVHFEYEAHTNVQGNTLSGGLRIREITSKDEKGVLVSRKNYIYDDILLRPNIVYEYTGRKIFGYMSYNPTLFETILKYKNLAVTFLTSTNNTTLGINGQQIFYRKVTEIIGEQNGTDKYKNEYYYDFYSNPDISGANNSITLQYNQFPFPQIPIDHPLNGTLKKTINYGYNAESSSYYKISESENIYHVETKANRHSISCMKVACQTQSPTYERGSEFFNLFSGISPFKIAKYTLESYWVQSVRNISRTYDKSDPSGYIESTVLHTYGNPLHGQPTQIETRSSENIKNIQKFKYALDYDKDKLTDEQSLFIIKMQEKHILNVPIEKQVWKEKLEENISMLYSGELTAYHPLFFKPVKQWVTELQKPISGFNNEGWFMSDTEKYIPKIFMTYDEKGNLLEKCNIITNQCITNFWNSDGIFKLGEVDLANAGQIFHTSFEETEGVGAGNNNEAKTGNKSWTGIYTKTLSNLPTGAYILSYWYKQGSEWKLGMEQVSVQDQGNGNGSYQIYLTAGQVDEIRFCPVNSLMSTFTFEPGLGITSKTDKNHQTVYYEYDSFNRLSLIRDENKNILQKYDYQIYKQ